MRNVLIPAFLTLALFGCATAEQAQTEPGALYAALEARDVAALGEVAQSRSAEGRLAASVLAAMRRDDDEAIAGLNRAAADRALGANLRRTALRNLSGIYLRQSRFADAVRAMEAADTFGADEDPTIAAASAQALVFARALTSVPAMRARVAPGEITITRDAAQLARADVVINGATQSAVLDTGAGFSTISQSAAERLGLRLLDADVTVGSATSDAVASRLGVADTLRMAGGAFRNVVFIVLPDSALSFANGAYTIPAIIGFPVLIELDRIEFALTPAGEVMRHAPSPFAHGPGSNLILDGPQPLVTVRVDDIPLIMMLDTGARVSNLTRATADAHPELIANAETRSTTIGGAGGMATHDDALAIPEITLHVGAVPVTLRDIRVLDRNRIGAAGLLGQDVMRSGGGYVIDFDAMRFEITPRS